LQVKDAGDAGKIDAGRGLSRPWRSYSRSDCTATPESSAATVMP
jgi:hypothetical protein